MQLRWNDNERNKKIIEKRGRGTKRNKQPYLTIHYYQGYHLPTSLSIKMSLLTEQLLLLGNYLHKGLDGGLACTFYFRNPYIFPRALFRILLCT